MTPGCWRVGILVIVSTTLLVSGAEAVTRQLAGEADGTTGRERG